MILMAFMVRTMALYGLTVCYVSLAQTIPN